jgi:hypothetical protein
VCVCVCVCVCVPHLPNNLKSNDSASVWTSQGSSSLVFWQMQILPLDSEEKDLSHTESTARTRAVEMAKESLQPALHRCQRGLIPLLEKLSGAPVKRGHDSVLDTAFHLKGAGGPFHQNVNDHSHPRDRVQLSVLQQLTEAQPVSMEPW